MAHSRTRIAVYIGDMFYRIVIAVFHWLLSVMYWSRGRRVPPVKNPILKMSATELAKQIRERMLSSQLVVRAFIDRVLEVEPYINATVERRFTEAVNEAKEADALIASGMFTKQQLADEKPLLGVPFTVKVLLTVKGLKSTASSLLFMDVRAQKDAPTVAMMKEAGAIVLATTNSAEMGLNFESNNYAHGTTCNPYDTNRTSGGSSGGESAIVAAAGSVIGLGNDMAGSIRVPCMFSGLFGHKPTRGLVPNGGSFPMPTLKAERLLYTGPMCRYAIDLETTMKILSAKHGKRFRYGQEEDFSSLKVYYVKSFGNIPFVMNVDPEIQDAVMKVASYFEKKHGSRTKEAIIPLLKQSNNIYYYSLLSSIPDIAEVVTAGKMKINGPLELLKFVFRQSIFTIGPVMCMNAHNVSLFNDASKAKRCSKLEEELSDQLSAMLDDKSVLILPTIPFPAPYHNEMSFLLPSVCYTNIFNILGLPVTQCPVGLNKQGLPIGVQIVGRMENDALTIACAIELEKAFDGWLPPKK